MAIQFGPKLPKGRPLQKGQPLPKPNTPINNEPKPGATTKEHKGSIEEVKNGQPGDFTIVLKGKEKGATTEFRFQVYYKSEDGSLKIHKVTDLSELSQLNGQDSYYGPNNK